MALPVLRDPTVFPLTLGRLPATKGMQAILILAVPLVPTVGLVGLSTALAEADPRPQTPVAPGRTTPIQSILVLSHGSWCPLGPARGGSAKASSGTFIPWRLPLRDPRPHYRFSLRRRTLDCDQRLNRGGEGNAAVAAASALSEVDGEGNIHIDVRKQRKETRKMKETRKDTSEVVVA